MGSRNTIKLLIAISAGWLVICSAIIGSFLYAELHKSQWQKDADLAADNSETHPKRTIALYEKAIAEAQNDNAPVNSRLDLMEKHADALFSDGQYAAAKAAYHQAGLLAYRSRLLERQSNYLIYEARAWHEAYKLGLAELPDTAMIKTALALRSSKEDLPNAQVQTAHLALAEIFTDHEQYGKALALYKKSLADASTLKDGDGKREARLGMIALAIIQKNYREGNDIFLEGVDDKDGDANTLRANYLAMMDEAENTNSDAEKIKAHLLALLQEQNYSQLDQFFSKEIKKEDELPSGLLSLDTYLSDLNDLAVDASASDWEGKIDKLSLWNQKCPLSQAARLVLANVLVSYAVSLKTHTDNGDKTTNTPQVYAILARAQSILNEEKARTPSWYSCSQAVVLNGTFDPKRFDQIIAECQRKFPHYKQTIFSKAASLLPDSHGSEGEVEKYVADECRKLPPSQSDIMYAQTVMYLETFATDGTLNATNLSWERTRKGMQSLIALHKDWLVGKALLSILATEVSDTKTAESAFAD
jgi:hypothetical protein